MFTPEEINAMMERIRNGTASTEDWEALHQALSQPTDVLQIPLRQEQINFIIGELKGRDIQIGDRFTTEQILGQKNIYVSVDEIKTREFNQTSPYKGLKKFEPEDKEFFFGRDQFITELANELERTNLLLLLGASGSGKSSVVRAGLLSWLQKERGSRLVNLTFTPDQDPFESLYGSLLRYYKQPEAQVAREGREDTLTQVVTGLRRSDSFWFIFVDQFEELFTTSQGEKRDRFIAGLVQLNTALKLLGSTKDCPVKIVATMRADFLDRFSPYPTLVKATDKHRPLIAEMRVDELRQAIEQPAAHHGVVFETGLVEEITKDVQGQAGYLPLLQYTLNLVWETEEKNGRIHDRTLNISTYRGLGGVRGALQKRVNQIYEALPEAERLAAQRIFLKLVEIGGDEESGTEWKPVRRRALRSEFDSELEQRVLVQLIDENLLVSDRPSQAQESTVEIAHEALLTSWETLNTWIKENRQAIGLRNRLNDDVARWQAKKAEDELWTGSKLEQVLELKKNPTFNQVMGGFSSTANQFIDASLGLRDRVRKRQIRQARTIASVSIGAVILVSTAGLIAMLQRQEAIRQKQDAERQAEISLAQQLIAQAEVAKNQKTGELLQRSMLIAIEGSRRLKNLNLPTSEADSILRYGLTVIPPHSSQSPSSQSSINLVQFSAGPCLVNSAPPACKSPDGKYILQVTDTPWSSLPHPSRLNSLVNILDAKTQKVLAILPHTDGIASIAFSRDSRYITTVEGDSKKRSRIWDLDAVRTTDRTIEDESISSATFSSDSKSLIVRIKRQTENKDNDDLVKKIDLETGDMTGSKFIPKDSVLSADGKYAAITHDGASQVLEVADARLVLSLSASPIAFSLDGNYLATIDNQIFKVLELGTQRIIFQKQFSELIMNSALDRPGTVGGYGTYGEKEPTRETFFKHYLGDTLVEFSGFTVSEDNVYFFADNGWVASLWRLPQNKVNHSPAETRTNVASLSRNGKYFAVQDWHNNIYVLDVSNWKEIRRIQNEGRVGGLAFSADEKFMATVSFGNTIRIIEVSTGRVVYYLKDESIDNIGEISFSPDGNFIAGVLSSQGGAKVWSLKTENLVSTVCSRLTRNLTLSEWKQVFGETLYQKTCPSLPSPEDFQKDTVSEEAVQSTNPPDVTPTSTASQLPPPLAASQLPSTPAETPFAPTVSPSSSPSTSSYKFEFPQASCGDPSAKPGSAFPVFIDNQPIEEIRKKYCADAYSVSNRQKTGKPSVQVASFSDRQKAEAFAKEVSGGVGEP